MPRALALTAVLGMLILSGCFSPNIFAAANAGPHIASVTPPVLPVDGQPSHWTVSWSGGEPPYSIEMKAYAEVGFAQEVDSATYSAANITSPYQFDITLPDRNVGYGYDVHWRVEIRDSQWTVSGGGGNPFFPSYQPMDGLEGTVTTHAP
jgi:hypothetical protein